MDCFSSQARPAISHGGSLGRKRSPSGCGRWANAPERTIRRDLSRRGAIRHCSVSAAASRGSKRQPAGNSMIELGVTPTMIQPVILCGGSGTRLWPLSREHHPKPLHAINGERTLLQQTATRCREVAAISEPLVICNEAHRFMVQTQLARAGAKPRAILLEPKGRGTAPALTLAAVHCVTADDPVLLAMPSDHRIADEALFRRAVERGAALAQQGFIVTFGVPPRAPETGYGYLRAGRALGSDAAHVDAFVE